MGIAMATVIASAMAGAMARSMTSAMAKLLLESWLGRHKTHYNGIQNATFSTNDTQQINIQDNNKNVTFNTNNT